MPDSGATQERAHTDNCVGQLPSLDGAARTFFVREAFGTVAVEAAPPEIAVGIPVKLLHQRPDVVAAKLDAAARSPRIGVAQANLDPRLLLTGTYGLWASDSGRFDWVDIFRWRSRAGRFDSPLRSNILNHDPVTNAVNLENARFQALMSAAQTPRAKHSARLKTA